MIDPAAQTIAKRKERAGRDTARAISKTSGGMGKKELSARESKNRAGMP